MPKHIPKKLPEGTIYVEEPVYIILPCLEPLVFGAWEIVKGIVCDVCQTDEGQVREGMPRAKRELVYVVKLDTEYLKRKKLVFPYDAEVSLLMPRETLHRSRRRAAHILRLSFLEESVVSVNAAAVLRLH